MKANIETKSPLATAHDDLAGVRQEQSEGRLAADAAVATRRSNLASLVTKKRHELETARAALEVASKKLVNVTRTDDREILRCEIETQTNLVNDLVAELETLAEMLR